MKHFSRLSLSLILGMGIAGPAFAVGEEDTPPKPTETTKECPDGEIWDKDSKSCIKSSAAIIDDDQRYDAVRELAGADGLQVHRSWWVARQGIQDEKRIDGRSFLVLPSGTEVPVSRSYRAKAKEAGLIR